MSEARQPAGPGYYPGFSTLAQEPHWDEATRRKIQERMKPPEPSKFLTAVEARTLQAVLDCVMPQDDRAEGQRIPVLAMIDQRLHERKFDGYIFAGTPEDDVAYRTGLAALEKIAQATRHKTFAALAVPEREAILLSLRDEDAGPDWPSAELPPKYFWGVLVRDAASAYYAHPFAWDEIGFGGPAYPRGYTRLTDGRPEPWEVDEQRHAWHAPGETCSDTFEDNKELFAPSHENKGAE